MLKVTCSYGASIQEKKFLKLEKVGFFASFSLDRPEVENRHLLFVQLYLSMFSSIEFWQEVKNWNISFVQLYLSMWLQVDLESWSDQRSLESLTLVVVVDVFLLWREETPWHTGDFHHVLDVVVIVI